ncbi:MAG: hypothetical protein JXR53_14950 [Bacteroidales bacterium]|nr:hypothetical protein [Bacteroidales bacterium]
MKNLFLLLAVAGIFALASCGGGDKKNDEKAKQDSIQKADSLAQIAKEDSIKQAEEMAAADSIATDSLEEVVVE